MTRKMLGVALVIVAAGCDARAPRAGPAVAAVAIDSTHLIRPDGIGHVVAGMTIGSLRAALPPGWSLGPAAPFMVDVDAMPVMRGNDSLYYVLAASGESTADDAAIVTVATDDTTFRTALGVGPGMTIAAAAGIYGPATLSYNTNDESREYITFAGYQQESVRFRATAPLEGTMAGVYTTDGEHNTTDSYDPHALIGLVLVRLRE